MKNDAYIALVAVIIFTTVNFIGGLVNDAKGYAFGTDKVIECIPFHLIFGFMYWLTCLPKIRIRKSLRLPILRTIFWTLIAIGMWTGDSLGQMAAGDFMDAAIPPFCFFINTIGLALNDIEWLRDLNFYVIGISIIGVTFYQILVLELATMSIEKIKTRHTTKAKANAG